MVALTIGMATYNDYNGVYFTLQALRLYQDLRDTELLVIDNYGCPDTKALVEGWVHGGRYLLAARLLRGAQAHTREALVEAIGRPLDAPTAKDARGFFSHCGYCSIDQRL